MTFRTASGQKVSDEGIRTIERNTEYGFTRSYWLYLDSQRQVIRRTGGCIVNERAGSKIPVHLKHGVYTIKLWVKRCETRHGRESEESRAGYVVG